MQIFIEPKKFRLVLENSHVAIQKPDYTAGTFLAVALPKEGNPDDFILRPANLIEIYQPVTEFYIRSLIISNINYSQLDGKLIFQLTTCSGLYVPAKKIEGKNSNWQIVNFDYPIKFNLLKRQS